MRIVPAAVALLLVLSACGTDADETGSPAASSEAQNESVAPTEPDADLTAQPWTADPAAEGAPSGEPPVEQLKATPALPEGPYYPTEAQRPSDRDADLLLLRGSPAIASGDPLLLDGKLLDLSGSPVADATVELWQTDVQGIYLHPDDPRTGTRDAYFQSYGETLTDAAGTWSFRTIVPAAYEDRPRHLHLKVRLDSVELLTTQLFFAGDSALQTDEIAASLGENLVGVSLSPEPGSDEAGLAVQTAEHILVVDLTP